MLLLPFLTFDDFYNYIITSKSSIKYLTEPNLYENCISELNITDNDILKKYTSFQIIYYLLLI